MEIITGHIKEVKERITGSVIEYCASAPVLVKDSAGTLLYTKNAGETATITDTLIKDSAGTLLHTVKAQGPVTTIPDVVVKNSENTVLATIKAEAAPTTIADITITKSDGSTISYPAKKDYTETPNTGSIMTGFAVGDTLNYTHTILAKEAGIYTGETLVNVATIEYKVNTVVKTLPITFVAGDEFLRTITQTNAALASSVEIYF